MSKQITENQHWIPQQYLGCFVDKTLNTQKPQFWVYDTLKLFLDSDYKPELKTPKSFASKHFFYESPDILPINLIENTLGKYETKFAKVRNEKIFSNKNLDKNDYKDISYFISTLEARTPTSKMNVENSLDEILKHCKALEEQYMKGKKSKTTKEFEFLKEKNISFIQLIGASIDVNRWQFSDIQILTIAEDSELHFISGNNPVSIYDMTYMNNFCGLCPTSSTIETVIPISPKHVLFINNAGYNGYFDITYNINFIDEVNYRMIYHNTEFLISSRKLDTRTVERLRRRNTQSFILLNQREQIEKDFFGKRGVK